MFGKRTSDPSELQIALDNRAFEIQLFWQRSNYFLVLITALGVGVLTVKDQKLGILIAIFGVITSWYWYKTNLGSKFWQENWEVEVVNLAQEHKIASFERPLADIVDQVRDSFAKSSVGKGFIQKWLDRQILKKPSVSYYMTMLSLSFTVLWMIALSIFAYDYWVAEWHPQKPKVEQVAPKRKVGAIKPKVERAEKAMPVKAVSAPQSVAPASAPAK